MIIDSFFSSNKIEVIFMEEISMDDLLKLKDVHIIDIRRKEKYIKGHIPSAISIPRDEFFLHISFFSKNKHYYLYCDNGVRSLSLVKKMNLLGYSFTNIHGGYNNYLLRK